MTQIKNKDFVEIEYTGKIKEDNQVFDTTDEKIAKENNIYSEKMNYGPIVICIGEKQVLAGLDKHLEGKETNKEYKIELKPEEAFGKKNAKLLKMIPLRIFKEQGITPVPGLQVSIDGMLGTIRTATSGRMIVDFNHPLAGKEIIYNIKLNKIITDNKEKIKEYVKLQLNQKDVEVEITNNEANVKLKTELPKEIIEQFNKKIIELIPDIKKLDFIVEKPKTEEKKKVSETQSVLRSKASGTTKVVSEHAQKSKNSKEFLGHENPKDFHKSSTKISDKTKEEAPKEAPKQEEKQADVTSQKEQKK